MEDDGLNEDVFYKSKWGRKLVPVPPPPYSEAVPASSIMSCNQCGKEFRNSYSLWAHNKVCSTIQKSKSVPSNPDIVTKLLEQNQDLLTRNMQLTDKIIEPINNTTFNMNFYVNNNNCKEPINTGEFVSVVKPQLEKLDGIQSGHATSVTNIITSRLRDIETAQQQPDVKREPIYTKADTSWIKKGVEIDD